MTGDYRHYQEVIDVLGRSLSLVTAPDPVSLAPAVIVANVAVETVAVHAQFVAEAVTETIAVPPAADGAADAGEMENVHAGAAPLTG